MSKQQKHRKHRKHCKPRKYDSSSSSDDERPLKINIDLNNDCEKKSEICRNDLIKMLLFPQCCKGPQGIQGNIGPPGSQGIQGNIGPQGEQGIHGDPGIFLISGIISPCDGSEPTIQTGTNYTATHFVDSGQNKWTFTFNSNVNVKNVLVSAVNGLSNNSVQVDANCVVPAVGNVAAYIQEPLVVSLQTPLEGFTFLALF